MKSDAHPENSKLYSLLTGPFLLFEANTILKSKENKHEMTVGHSNNGKMPKLLLITLDGGNSGVCVWSFSKPLGRSMNRWTWKSRYQRNKIRVPKLIINILKRRVKNKERGNQRWVMNGMSSAVTFLRYWATPGSGISVGSQWSISMINSPLFGYAQHKSARKLGNKRLISTLSEWRYFHYL